jgi:hypothetical protein
MAIENILSEIDAEIARLQRARALLATLDSASTKTARSTKKAKAPAAVKPRKRRRLSAEARKRISEAQQRRWAKQKAKAK